MMILIICLVSLLIATTVAWLFLYKDVQKISRKLGLGIRIPMCYQEKCGAPIIALEEGGNLLYFLVDSGCNISLLLRSAVENLPLEKGLDCICGVKGTQDILGMCEKTLTSKSGVHLTIKFSVVESVQALEETAKALGVPIAGIIGTDMLTHNFIIDFKDNVICA